MARKSFKAKKVVTCYSLNNMKVVELNRSKTNSQITAAIGIFDGLHRGHKKLLNALIQHEPNMVITFYKHPRQVKMLQSLSERLRNFKGLGINKAIIFSIKDNIIHMSVDNFINDVIKPLGIRTLITGSDFRMGKNRDCGVEEIKRICDLNGIQLIVIDVVNDSGKKLSSTDIRDFVQHGNMPKASSMLGHSLQLHGIVIKGKGNGAKIGFRTANIKLNTSRINPEFGVYVTRTHLDGSKYDSVTFIGKNHDSSPIIETHIINFSNNIYGKRICVELLEKLREIKKFPNFDELANAISNDLQMAVKKLHSYK